MLDAGIGGKGDVVDRRHELRDQDLRQEQARRVDAERMGIQVPPGNEDVGLALDDPEQLARRHQDAIAGDPPGASKVEARAYPCTRRHHHADGARPEQHHRRQHQGPHAQPPECAAKSREGTEHGREQVHRRLAPEIHGAAQQRIGKGDEGGGEIQQRLHAQQLGDLGVPEIGGRQRCRRDLEDRECPVQHQQHPEQLPDRAIVDLRLLDQRARKAVAVQHVEHDQHDLGHGEQAVILRAQDPDHQEGGRPCDQLADDLRAGAPQNRRADLLPQRFGGAIRLLKGRIHGSGLCRAGAVRHKNRRNPGLFNSSVTFLKNGFDGFG